jgi:hypothetical protein
MIFEDFSGVSYPVYLKIRLRNIYIYIFNCKGEVPFITTMDPLSTLYPPIVQSLSATCGTPRGPGGRNLNVSLIAPSKYGNFN